MDNENEKKPKLAFIVDIRGWAFDTVAQNLQRKLSSYFEVAIIYWEDHSSSEGFVRHLVGQGYSYVHFFFREHLKLLLETGNAQDRAMKAFMRCTVTTHIPDYLYSSQIEIAARLDLFSFVDGYFTTNKQLYHTYAAESLIPPPDRIIFDWPRISVPEKKPSRQRNVVRIVWCGNSKWGEYAGHSDYKGLKSIIEPAIAQLHAQNAQIEFTCLDSALQKVPHDTVLHELANGDILLIASEAEGTPLTFIEALACGCAVVSTRVGIVEEVLRGDQQNNIVERTSKDFALALSKLVDNPALLEAAQASNRTAYEEVFGGGSSLEHSWLDFLEQARRHGMKNGAARKAAALSHSKGLMSRILITTARKSVNIVRQAGLIPAINAVSPFFGQTYNKLIHGGGQRKTIDYFRLQPVYEDIIQKLDPSKPAIIYAPMWKGVAASTEALFPNNLLRFPYFDTEYPEVDEHQFLQEFCSLITASSCRVIVFSGGSRLHYRVAQMLKEKRRDLKLYFLWHGSPAQWVEYPQLAHYREWHSLYREGVLNGFISLKHDLHETLQKMGIRGYTLTNPIPPLHNKPPQERADGELLNVGVFSALNSWYKNPYVQLLALAGRKDVRLHTNIGDSSQLNELDLGVGEVEIYPHLSRPEFLNLLAKLDVNLYVTNTECSPMIALESWALGIPCIVGPAGDIYSAVNDELAEYLVLPQVDNPEAISRRLCSVTKHLAHVKSLLSEFKHEYNQICADQLALLFDQIMTDKPYS